MDMHSRITFCNYSTKVVYITIHPPVNSHACFLMPPLTDISQQKLNQSNECQIIFLHKGHDEKMTKNPPHLVSRMRMVMNEAKLPRICSTVDEKSSVTLSIGIGFQFLTSTHTAHNTSQIQPRLQLEGITVTRLDVQFGLTRYLSTGAHPGIYYRGEQLGDFGGRSASSGSRHSHNVGLGFAETNVQVDSKGTQEQIHFIYYPAYHQWKC